VPKTKTGTMVVEHLLSERKVSVIGISDLILFGFWDLRFGILGLFSEKKIYFYLSQL